MPAANSESFQSRFHRRWGRLRHADVRALAWLLDSPGLLDADAVAWQGRVATLGEVDDAAAAWLAQLDQAPEALEAWLDVQRFTRLGRYAEKLMAFYFRHRGVLVAHGTQVRTETGATIGELDFLIRDAGGRLLHWEFATKLYLLQDEGNAVHADSFVGPNLADSLGAKMRKIMERQLALARHPSAQPYLPGSVEASQALVKGWLFYRHRTPPPGNLGISPPHCRGFWCEAAELEADGQARYLMLPRLRWLAPARATPEACMGIQALQEALRAHFETMHTPVLVAKMGEGDDPENALLEVDRGFIVPDGWRDQAGERVSRMIAAG
ncbi:hypothetical protein SAMN06265795_104179 [Noviherbaspirillum humi]|uniref:DUF1853 domain-containing protein n=1 Tax=Noviherbaspirillum humi TaxID=1688639 RepID=A0A239G055_9BURK|nr:DUF1853 family protein [Noviherbaspirillum humi]SNS62420.1 hypothetical protein SAMN06265795_104179 [Noviherbaspirillum humi]